MPDLLLGRFHYWFCVPQVISVRHRRHGRLLTELPCADRSWACMFKRRGLCVHLLHQGTVLEVVNHCKSRDCIVELSQVVRCRFLIRNAQGWQAKAPHADSLGGRPPCMQDQYPPSNKTPAISEATGSALTRPQTTTRMIESASAGASVLLPARRDACSFLTMNIV